MKTLLLIIFLSICSLCFGQIADNTNRNNDRNIYYQALVSFYKTRYYDKSAILDTIFVVKAPPTTDSIRPLFSDRVIFIILTKEQAQERMNKDENFRCVQLSPLAFEDNIFYIRVREMSLKYSELERLKIEFRFSSNKFRYIRAMVVGTGEIW